MGLFDFVKDAGAKVFGKDEPKPSPQVRDVDPARLELMKRNKALQNLVAELGLQVENLKIEVTGSTAVVSGLVDDQAEREKVVLAVGNVIGIARVDDRLEAKKKAPEAQMHTVVAGDTLSKIAKKYYGNRQRRQVPGDLRGQPADAQGPGQDLPRPGPAHPAARALSPAAAPRLRPSPSCGTRGACRRPGRSSIRARRGSPRASTARA
ncbi:MAG: hypothetical protein H6Q03_1181 [Acidobacteria bacterium]|nr:hypothetical protein [Acidobacteriota bacterium]